MKRKASALGNAQRRRRLGPTRRIKRRRLYRAKRRSFSRRVKRVVFNLAESKRIDQAPLNNNPLDGQSGWFLARLPSSLPQGTNSTSRIGNKVVFRTICMFFEGKYLGNVSANNDNSVYVDFYLAVYKPGNEIDSTFLMTSFMDNYTLAAGTNYNTSCFRNQYDFKDWKVLRRTRLTLTPQYAGQDVYRMKRVAWKGYLPVTYGSNLETVTPSENQIVLIALTTPNIATGDVKPLVSCNMRMWYKDV